MKFSILFIIICILVFGCELDKVTITDIQKGFTFDLTKPDHLIGSRSGDAIEFEGKLRSINEDVNNKQVIWMSDKDGVIWDSHTNMSGYIHFYYSDLSNNLHNIYIILIDPDLEQPDTLNQFIVHNYMPECIDLNLHRFIGNYIDNLYFIGDYERTWSESDSISQLNNMHLVTITSEAENTFLKYAIPTDNFYEYDEFWIGLFYNPLNSIVEWVTGESIEFTGYPDQAQMPDIERSYGFVYINDYYHYYNDYFIWGSEASADTSSSWHDRKNYIAEYEGNK